MLFRVAPRSRRYWGLSGASVINRSWMAWASWWAASASVILPAWPNPVAFAAWAPASSAWKRGNSGRTSFDQRAMASS